MLQPAHYPAGVLDCQHNNAPVIIRERVQEYTHHEWGELITHIRDQDPSNFSAQSDTRLVNTLLALDLIYDKSNVTPDEFCARLRQIYTGKTAAELKNEHAQWNDIFKQLRHQMRRRALLIPKALDDEHHQEILTDIKQTHQLSASEMGEVLQLACENESRFGRVATQQYFCYSYCLSFALMMTYNSPESTEISELHPMFNIYSSSTKDVHKLVAFFLEIAYRGRLQRKGDTLYKPVLDSDGHYLYSYEYYMDIKDWVWHELSPIEDPRNAKTYSMLVSSSRMVSHVCSVLENCRSIYLRDLKCNPEAHGFTNGVYILNQDEFYYFNFVEDIPQDAYTIDTFVGGSVVVSKHHAVEFKKLSLDLGDIDLSNPDNNPGFSFRDIIPDTCRILEAQHFTAAEQVVVYGLLGRMLYAVGSHDQWSVFPYFLGLAGTGKSSLLNLLASMFDKSDVGYVNNVLQKTFALDGLMDKRIFLGLDIDQNFQLDQATYQSMVTGEPVSVTRKFKQPISVKWTVPGAFAGNQLPSWTDNSGSLARRLVIIYYKHPVRRVDTRLLDKCKAEIATFLQVINVSYRFLLEKYSDTALTPNLPPKFGEAQEEAQKALDSLFAFIVDGCEVRPIIPDPEEDDFEDEYNAPWSMFKSAYRAYCKENRIPAKVITQANSLSVFTKQNIHVEKIIQADGSVLSVVDGLRVMPRYQPGL